jgi:hypothetical protein
MRIERYASLLLLMIVAPVVSGAAINKCTLPDGSTEYSDGPCPAAPAAPTSSTAPLPTRDSVELRKIVLVLNGGSDMDATLDVFTVMQMRVIGGNDSTWKRDNPNWAPVFNLVKADLRRDLAPVVAAQVTSMAAQWDQALAAHLSADDTVSLLKFFHSPLGQQFVEFQKALLPIQVQGSSAMMVGLASGGMAPGSVPVETPSPELIAARKRLLSLSWVSLMMSALGQSPSHGKSPSDDKAINTLILDVIAKTRGPSLDALERKFHDGLASFSTFEQSSQAKALLAVYRAMAAESSGQPDGANDAFLKTLKRSTVEHAASWNAAYQAGRPHAQSAVPATAATR